ncbi:MAG: nitroreductase [Roseiarcus sp.]
MRVHEAVVRRFSARAFLPRAPDALVVRRILERALRAPSGGNLQPWRVVALTGAPLAALVAEVGELIARRERETPDYAVYPENLWEPYLSRRFQSGEDLYASLGVARADKAGRWAQFHQNFRLFGAPVGLYFVLDRRVGPTQWADIGMFMQTVMLLAAEEGLDTCAQEAWSRYPATAARHLELGDNEMMFAGMALGYADFSHPINGWRARRAAFDDVVTMRGF